MSQLSKLRAALNASARPGETVKITKGVTPADDPGRGEVLNVELTVFRYDCLPPMEGRLTLQDTVSERQVRFVPGGFPAIADKLWAKLRGSDVHPDHPNSPQSLLAGVAAATGMSPAEVDKELQDALAEEVAELNAQVAGGLRPSVKTATVPPNPAAAQAGEPTEGAP